MPICSAYFGFTGIHWRFQERDESLVADCRIERLLSPDCATLPIVWLLSAVWGRRTCPLENLCSTLHTALASQSRCVGSSAPLRSPPFLHSNYSLDSARCSACSVVFWGGLCHAFPTLSPPPAERLVVSSLSCQSPTR